MLSETLSRKRCPKSSSYFFTPVSSTFRKSTYFSSTAARKHEWNRACRFHGLRDAGGPVVGVKRNVWMRPKCGWFARQRSDAIHLRGGRKHRVRVWTSQKGKRVHRWSSVGGVDPNENVETRTCALLRSHPQRAFTTRSCHVANLKRFSFVCILYFPLHLFFFCTYLRLKIRRFWDL